MSELLDIRRYFAALIEKKTGIVYNDTNGYQLDSRLLDLSQQFGFGSVEKLYDAAKNKGLSHEQELMLHDIATNNETSFFRDIKVFNAIRTTLSQLMNRPEPIHIWSAACSTGQETYSLAMMVAELGISPGKCTILASDISDRVIAKASQGVYSQLEVQRGLPIQMMLKYFEAIDVDTTGQKDAPKLWKIRKNLLPTIEFKQLNLLDEWTHPRRFDLILCRNVLIYQSVENKAKVVHKIFGCLGEKGNLVLGGAESLMGVSEAFESQLLEGAVMYAKRRAG